MGKFNDCLTDVEKKAFEYLSRDADEDLQARVDDVVNWAKREEVKVAFELVQKLCQESKDAVIADVMAKAASEDLLA